MTEAGSRAGTALRSVRGDPDGAMEPLRIRLLGPFRVSIDGRLIEARDWRLRKAAALVKLLALAPGHRLHREEALDLLWPELEKGAAENNLHHALHVARRTLDPSGALRAPRLEGAAIVLAPPVGVWTDVEAFEAALAEARRARNAAAYRRALALYTGDLVPDDRYEDWASDRRTALRSLFVSGLLELAGLYKEEGEYGEALATLQRAVREEPALEEAHVELMRLYARAGQRQGALRQYEQLRGALARELDAEPEAASRALYEDILAGRIPAIDKETPRAPVQGERRHNLPVPLSSFVGRDAAVAELADCSARCRLLTLTGAGGAGKTRLVGMVARRLLPLYEDGAWMVELASISDGALIGRSVARALSIEERSDEPLEETIVSALRRKRLLLVLDNCEHLIEASARLAELLLSSCPHLHILATSRELLNLPGETAYGVPPLSLPDPRSLPPVEEMAEMEAVRLFVERARARQPAFALTPENALAVARICRQVDGLPLAIELAAARIGMLSVEAIAERLANAPAFLTGGSRTADPRQQTLRGALDWSYNLLSEGERGLLRRLSVFAGGWALEAAEAIGSDTETPDETVLDLLSRLVDKSLVLADVAAGGNVRYAMLEPVRQYARTHLVASGEIERTALRHAEYFVELLAGAQAELLGPRQAYWFERLDREHDNLRAALRYAVDGRRAEIGLQIMGLSWRFWAGHGHGTEGRSWLSQLFALRESDEATSRTRATAFHAAGVLAYYGGDYAEATVQYERELTLLRELDDRGRITILLSNLGLVVKEQGEYERAMALHEEGLALAIEIGDELGQSANLNNLGILHQDMGNHERAIELHERALVFERRRGDRRGIMITLNNLAAIALERGEHARVADYAEDALAIAQDLGHVQSSIVALANLGLAALEAGDLGRAWERLEEALRLVQPIDDKRRSVECLEHTARLACAEGRYRRVAMLCGAASRIRAASGMGESLPDRPRLERSVREARDALGAPVFEAATGEGEALTLQEALRYALTREEDEPAPVATLTPREREIARLVARGRTNRQIAEELTIAERTVDTHVRNLLGKLGASSRTQVESKLRGA